ncbi:MAG: SurA N-terminal domain-containing protein [Proteobacteria bacterium]|nr:SurA N-terminal domain-containing protein [Pseudomonadota bacterium]
MLTFIRKNTQSFVVKILAGLLIASFAMWGINDVFSIVYSAETVIEIGDVEFSPPEVKDHVRREIARLRPVLGNQFSIDDARKLGVIEAVVQRLINDTALQLATRSLGVAISDDLVRRHIRNAPEFQGLGGFDRFRFQQTLNNNTLTEEGYIKKVRNELGRDFLLASFGGETAPKMLARSVYRHRQEKRIVDTIKILDRDQPIATKPDIATLAKFHQDNAARFTAPEYRSLTTIRLEIDDMVAEIAVTDEEIAKAYDTRLDDFTTQETRRVLQMIVAEEDVATRAHKALSEGRDFATVAQEVAKMDLESIDLGQVTRGDVRLLPELTEAIFSLGKDAYGAPVKSPLGWHLFYVTDVQKGGVKSLDEVRESLRQTIAREKAIDGLFALANRLEDSLGGGATLEEAATGLNLRIAKFDAVDSNAQDKAGNRIENLPGGDFLATAFATDVGADSPLIETGSEGYFILRVDGVTPPSLKPLDGIREEVSKAWKAVQRSGKAKKTAASVVARIKSGTGLDVIAGEMGLTIKTSPALVRRSTAPATDLPRLLMGGIFKIKPGEAVSARGSDGYYVARLKEIAAANPAADKAGLDEVSKQIGKSLNADIFVQLAGALRNRFGTDVNRRALNNLFSGTAGGPGTR